MASSSRSESRHHDVVVIGSGFGGSLVSWPLVRAGLDVLLLERGPWVERGPHNWGSSGTLIRSPYFDGGNRYRVLTENDSAFTGSCACVGGPSLFYGAVSLRFREEDFQRNPEIVADSGAHWPVSYDDLRPFYRQVERILHVAGRTGEDPTEPGRSDDYPAQLSPLATVSERIAEAARGRGLRPFRLPLAINYNGDGRGHEAQPLCVECNTCDTFACAIGAKNDLVTRVIGPLMARGLELRHETAVTRLHVEGDRVAAVECIDRRTGARQTITADTFVLAAGALGSAHLLLASGLYEMNPAGEVVGRYLTRHCSAIVYGIYRWPRWYGTEFHKQIGINDFYLGDPAGRGPSGKLGNIQQAQTPSMGMVESEMSRVKRFVVRPLVERSTGLLVLAEDQPQHANRVTLDTSQRDELGLPRLVVHHRYSERDLAARRFLIDRAKEIHRAAGAVFTYVHLIDTFSHSLGTVRMGDDGEHNPLDRDLHFRGVRNLFVVDGSALPTSAGVNPSLTIAANALRAGAGIAARARGEASR